MARVSGEPASLRPDPAISPDVNLAVQASLASNPITEVGPEVRERLASVDGVERVVIGDDNARIVWLCSAGEAHGRIHREAIERLRNAGVDPDLTQLDVVISAIHRERRVRYGSTQRVENPDRSISVRVSLEWEGEMFTAEAVGEKGDQIELRTAALATVAAIETVTGKSLGLRLVGVKHIRAFDGELIVVSISESAGRKTLLGSVLAGSDPFRATALSVLMALNRLLGNYLVTR